MGQNPLVWGTVWQHHRPWETKQLEGVIHTAFKINNSLLIFLLCPFPPCHTCQTENAKAGCRSLSPSQPPLPALRQIPSRWHGNKELKLVKFYISAVVSLRNPKCFKYQILFTITALRLCGKREFYTFEEIADDLWSLLIDVQVRTVVFKDRVEPEAPVLLAAFSKLCVCPEKPPFWHSYATSIMWW